MRSCLVTCLLLIFLPACAASNAPPDATLVEPVAAAIQPSHWTAISPTGTDTPPPPAATPSPTPTVPPAPQVCSPLNGIALAQINEMISNPYHPPLPGSDDPHQGVDLADRLPESQVAVSGRAVQAVLAGQVAAVVRDRFPYGNAVLIETPLEEALLIGWGTLYLPTAAPTLAPVSPLTCPPAPEIVFPNPGRRSLYLLYAHMAQPPALQPEDSIACGQTIGAVGSSGNAINPHLHLEVRVGPSGLRLNSLAHYDASASLEEMGSYCLWRISGLFQLVDPLQVLLSRPPG